MKSIPARKVKEALSRLDMKAARGNGSGHEVWIDQNGRRCLPVFRHKDVSLASLYALGDQLETMGICKRQDFMGAVRAS